MYRVRYWSNRNAGWLNRLYEGLARVMGGLQPLVAFIGYDRLEPPIAKLEGLVKGFLFDSQSCGQCILGSTGMVCPMNCPKSLRNGPCGGVRQDGSCYINPAMTCVWVSAWEGSQRIARGVEKIQFIQPPVDHRLQGRSAWLKELRELTLPRWRLRNRHEQTGS